MVKPLSGSSQKTEMPNKTTHKKGSMVKGSERVSQAAGGFMAQIGTGANLKKRVTIGGNTSSQQKVGDVSRRTLKVTKQT